MQPTRNGILLHSGLDSAWHFLLPEEEIGLEHVKSIFLYNFKDFQEAELIR